MDDEPSLLFLARLSLERAGHEVTEAANGEAALAHLGRTAFDVVVTDLMMPVMDGDGLLRHLRADERTRTVPVVVYSAVRRPQLVVDAVVTKPCDPEELAEAVARVLARRADAEGSADDRPFAQ